MADGKVVIDVTLDDGRVVKGVANIDSKLRGIGDAGKTAALGLKNLLSAIGITALVSKGIDMVKSSLDGAISRYDTLNNFPRVLQLMGFDAKDSKKAIDTLSKGIQGLPTTLDSVAKTTQRIALMTGDLKGATKITLALNDAFLASGASAADAERGLEQYVQMLSTGTVDLESWRTLQETMPIALNKTAEAFGYTGKSAQNDLYNALKKGEITFDQFNNKLIELDGGVGGFAELAKKSSGGIGTAFTNMQTAVVRGVTNIISSIDKMLTSNGLPNLQTIISNVGKKFEDVLNGIANNLPNIVSKIKEVYDTLKPWMPLIGSIVAGIIAFKATVEAINSVKNAFNALKIGIIAVNTALKANPFVFILSAAITAVLLIVQYWTPIKAFFLSLWEGIKSVAIAILEPIKSAWNSTVLFFVNLWNGIVGFFSNLWNGIASVAITIWNGVIVAWQTVVNTVVTIFTPIIAFFIGIWDNIKTAAAAYWEIIKNVILGPILLLIDLVTGNLNDFKSHLSQIWNNIKDAANTIWTSFKNIVMSIIDAFISGAKTIFNAFKQFITSIWSGIKTVSSTIWNAIVSGITTIINGFVETVKTVISGFKSFLESTWNSIKTTASSIWTALKQSISSIVTGMLTAIETAWNTIKDKTKAAFEAVVGFIQDPLKAIDLFQIGVDIIQGLINGIDSMASAVWDKVKSIVDGVKNAITGALSIHSPSRWMRDMVGKNMVRGWIDGIEENKSLVLKKSEQLADWMKPEISGFVNGLRRYVPISNIVTANVASGTSGRTITHNNNNTFSPQIVNNFVKTESSPSEIARKQKQQMQRLALEWGY